MKQKNRLRRMSFPAPFIFAFFILLLVSSCKKNDETFGHNLLKDFEQINLVGNNNEYAPAHVDATLLNAWGIAFSTGGTPWVNANGSGLSEVYDKDGNIVRPPVVIPSATSASGGTPTGIVFNSTTDFKLPNGNPARFIFDSEDGVLSGWNGGNNAVRVLTNADGVYKGLAIASYNGANYLYAANFKTGNVDVFDKNWLPVKSILFKDNNLPSDYAPFNVQTINDKIYVLYAKKGEGLDEEAGHGNGYVDVFSTNGTLLKRLVSRGQLNAPWGIAEAPNGFFDDDNNNDKHSVQNVILIGNFGDGHINAYTSDGAYLGQLRAHGKPIVIDGLWALMFPPVTATTVDPNRLYFTAGPDDEEDGLFGYIQKKN